MGLLGLKKYALGAGGMLVLVMAILLATGWGSAVAAQISSVFVTNDAAHPVPVHEQGTANVNVTNAVDTRDASTTTLLFNGVCPSPAMHLDVSHYRTVRVLVTSGTTPAQVEFGWFDQAFFPFAVVPLNANDFFTTTYDVPPSPLTCLNDSGSATVQIWGRP